MGKGNYKEKAIIVDEVVFDHYIAKTGKHIIHKAHSKLSHRILVKLGLRHNSITNSGTGGLYDVVSWVSGIASPAAAYTYIGIGTGTSADASTDTKMGTGVILVNVTPTRTNSGGSLGDQIQWTHVFSHANDSGLTGSSAINEVAIENVSTVATTGRMLLHISGGTNYGAVDNCNWDNGDTLTITITCKFEQGA